MSSAAALANAVVWMGLALNIFVVGVLWIGGLCLGLKPLMAMVASPKMHRSTSCLL